DGGVGSAFDERGAERAAERSPLLEADGERRAGGIRDLGRRDAQAVLPQETGELLDPGIHRMRKVARSATVRRMLIALLVCSPLLVQAKPGLTAIAPGTIAAHVRFLADDLLEGRGTGERGHAVAER